MGDDLVELSEPMTLMRTKDVKHLLDRIEELEAKLDWVIVERDETFALMLDRAQTAEAKLTKAVEALKIDPWFIGYGSWKKHVKDTLAELTGGQKDE